MTASTPDYFELLGVGQAFDVDMSTLEKNFRERSKLVHPDRHVGASSAERVAALQDSMTLNEAFKTLSKPSARAEYLLALHGIVIAEHERIDPLLIAEILDAREELAAAIAGGDQGRLESLEEVMLDNKDEILANVAGLFKEHAKGKSSEILEDVKQQLILLRYVDRYLEQFDELDDERAA